VTGLPDMDRRIDLAGPVNFRDMGGYRGDGGRRVRWRRVFRSDSLHSAGDDDARLIVERLGLATVIDLRETDEVARHGRGALAPASLGYHHLPLLGTEVAADEIDRITLREAYSRMLHASAARVVEILAVAADPAAQPLVFHCVAGKDRTGIVAALLLSALGVSDDDIVADYVLTQDVMPVMLERFAGRGVQRSGGPAIPSPLLRAEALTMHHLLDAVREGYGSAAGYARAGGAPDDLLPALQGALLEPGP